MPKKVILGTKFKKTIVELKIAPLNTPFYGVSSLTKHFQVLGPSFPKKSILGTKFRKIKIPSSLFWVIVKQFTKFWVIADHSVNRLGHCG